MNEKREHKRLNVVYKVTYSVASKPHRKTKTSSFNISLGGVGLNLKRFITDDEELALQIIAPHAKPIDAKGRLIWQLYLPDTAQKRAGVQFTEIPWTGVKSLL